jgi:hypothetical protein
VTRAVTLLGPQRRPSVQQVVGGLDQQASFAAVTAGWQERESDDAELRRLLGDRVVNLGLHGRWLDVLEQDPEYANAEREHEAALAELRQLYLIQLDHALNAAYGVAERREGRPRLRESALRDAVDVVRLLDEQHLVRVRAAQLAFFDAWRPQERPPVAAHREEVRRLLGSADALIVAGGHVGELVKVLHLFQVGPSVPETVVAWSAGAIALTDRVVLFHDHVPHGVAQTEVLGEGLGVIRDLVLLPHARRRLRVEDTVRMSVLARRFDPVRCLVLDDGVRVDVPGGGHLPAEARILGLDGRITSVAAA